MEVLKKFRKSIMFLLKTIIVLSLLVVFIYFWENYYADTYLNNGNYVIIFTYLLSFISFTVLYGGFKIGVFRTTEIVYSMSLGAVFANVIAFGELCLVVRRFLSPLPILAVTGIDILLILFLVFISNKIYSTIYNTKRILAIYDSNRNNIDTIRKIHHIRFRYKIENAITIQNGIEAIKNAIDKNDAIFIGDFDKKIKEEIIKYAYNKGKRFYILPSIEDMIINCNEIIQISDSPIIYCKNSGLTLEQRIIKRACDLLVTAVLTVAASPFMLITALAIKLYDGGPVFYKQERLTYNGKHFFVYKFRSMIVNAEEKSGAVLSRNHDNRITPVGKFIRAIRFDELPQLLNILKGDMSLVGPRPERPEIAEKYYKEIPEFSYRLKVKAGLTGYAQVFGKYNTTPIEKLKMDIYYIEKHSLLLDLKILIYTIKILFMRESTEGVKDK